MRKETCVTAGELRKRHGERVRFETSTGKVCEGKISIDGDGTVYLVHNNPVGHIGTPDDTLGFRYGCCIYSNIKIEPDSFSDNNNYNWIEFLEDTPEDPEQERDIEQEYVTQYVRKSDCLEFTETHIGDESIEDIDAKMKQYRSLIATHRKLFPKK